MAHELITFVLDEKAIMKQLEFKEEVIAELSQKYMAITVTGVDDKEGYEAAHAARMDIVHKRTDFSKRSKAFRDKLNEYPKLELKVEKRVLSLLEPIEDYLLSQEKIVDDEKARVKAESDRKEAARIQERIDKLYNMGLVSRNGNFYLSFSNEGYVPEAIIKTCSDDDFDKYVNDFQAKIDIENARIVKEIADKIAEEDRLEKIRLEQKSEFERLAKIADEQAKEAKKIQDEKDAIEAEKKRITDEQKKAEDEKSRKEELEKARKEAAEKAVKDAEEKRFKAEKAQKDKEERERIAAEKKAARAPDKEKLLKLVEEFKIHLMPTMKTDEGKRLLQKFYGEIDEAVHNLYESAKEL
jgi:DNA repair exonuclease SbcCD ATPase subunit